MARPFKHPKTGVFWLRKAVPAELRALVGKREELRTLDTKDPEEAKRLFVQAMAEVDARWANLRKGSQSLSERDAHDIAASVHDDWLAKHRSNPSEQNFWRTDMYDRLWPTRYAGALGGSSPRVDFDVAAEIVRIWCRDQAKAILSQRGLGSDASNVERLARAVAAAMQRASVTLQQESHGNNVGTFSTYPSSRVLEQAQPQPKADNGKPVPFDVLVDGWAAEKRPAEKTVYEWRRVAKKLAAFIGHDDARLLIADDLLRWKAAMVEAGLRAKTIRDAQLAPIRAILRWGVDNRRLETNVGERVSIDVRVKPGEAKRSFNDDEAALVLEAALKARDPVIRWVPWLCAYSGARVSEVCQLRREDIIQISGLWCMKFDPEAGSLKNANSERAVPIHDAVLESGFIDFARSVRSGPLFSRLPPDKFGKQGGNGTKVLGRWVRSLGLVDPRLAPNHSWRHRLKTSGRRFGLALDIVNSITGHARKSVADGYGEFPVEALKRELDKIPDLLKERSKAKACQAAE